MKPSLAVLLLSLAPVVHASPFEDADMAAGEQMHAEICVACHEMKFGGEGGSAIYLRPDRRVNSVSALKSQLTACTTQLSLPLFPEDEANLGAYLNHHYYKFETP
jgi:mono/diheme cytochrome c family protein